jgi:two-component system NtrC family sensor kinase
MRISLNAKLVGSFVLVVVTTGLVAMVIGVYVVGDQVLQQAQDKVKMDLNSAREVYDAHLEQVLASVRLTAERFFIKDNILTDRTGEMVERLKVIREKESLDILTLTDQRGMVVARTRNPEYSGDSQSEDELVRSVLLSEEAVAGTQIVSCEELLKESESLAEQAYMQFIPTPKAKPREELEETSGMMIKAAAPILDYDGTLIGVLYGGKMLNRNYEIVDKIKDILYLGHTYEGKEIGTATIFQKDLRISTNVETEDGRRAVGTRVSEEVYDRVLTEGEPWVARAFVVNDWYITAYEPIKDLAGEIVGILYVGILEKPYADMRRRTYWFFLGITLAGMVAAISISWFLARGVTRPVKRLVQASRRLALGDLDTRVELDSKDEMGQLGETFNMMAASVKESDRKLRETTQRKLMESEKLATIGRLAAGVAHEINNPLTAVMTFSHLMLEDSGQDDPRREDLELVIHETTRCRDIVRKLLDFSRERKPEKRFVGINSLIEQTLSILTTQAMFHDIKVVKKLAQDLPNTTVDPAQIQQVITNIIINAAEAMAEGGTLSVETRLVQDGKFIEMRFTDTGVGIDEEGIGKLFDPFYSTKEKGTGLGLSVTYGIVKSHEGRIGVESRVGEGATITILLPVKAEVDVEPTHGSDATHRMT